MKKGKKLTIGLLCGIVFFLTFSNKVYAEEAPWQSYTPDKWHNTIPAPNGYLPSRSISGAQIGCGDFKSAADMFYCAARKEIYIVDSGNARIIVLDESLELKKEYDRLKNKDGSEYFLSNPQGIFVLEDGTMYIAEYGNQEVVICDTDGNILDIPDKPQSTLLPENFNYLPGKIVVDSVGKIYVLSQGIYQGIIYLEPDGTFIKFFGPNDVEMTFKRQLMKLWKNILSDAAAATMQAFNPIEYGNMYMGQDGYIYATSAGTENGSKVITKLNPVGIDCLPFSFVGVIQFSDISVDENGIMTLLNRTTGRLAQLDENGKSIFLFGGIGNQVGLFQNPVSLIEVGGKMYVMDADKNTITEFELTQFGSMVREAIVLYNEGLYEESIQPWEEVIRHNSNYLLAYTGLGKAYYQLEQYDKAMYYYKLANDKGNYSVAFKEASLNKVRSSFGTIVFIVAVLITAIILFKVYRKKRKGAGI